MTVTFARRVLDRRRLGLYVPQYAVNEALIATGDLPPTTNRTALRRRVRLPAQPTGSHAFAGGAA